MKTLNEFLFFRDEIDAIELLDEIKSNDKRNRIKFIGENGEILKFKNVWDNDPWTHLFYKSVGAGFGIFMTELSSWKDDLGNEKSEEHKRIIRIEDIS